MKFSCMQRALLCLLNQSGICDRLRLAFEVTVFVQELLVFTMGTYADHRGAQYPHGDDERAG